MIANIRARLAAAICLPALVFACSAAPSSPTGSSTQEGETTKRCSSRTRPAACPGGGEASCTDGKWECAPLPSFCDPSTQPAACPGGGVAGCVLGQWQCAPLPSATTPDGCDPTQQPAACPGGGEAACNSGQWQCAPLPSACDPTQEPAACPGGGSPQCTSGQWACAPLPSCVPDGSQSQSNGSDCCSGNYDSNTNNCGQ